MGGRRLIHYSKAPLGAVHSVTAQSVRFKPNGLWVSVEGDDDWRQWCESEGFALDRLAFETEVFLRPDATILNLTGASDIDAFTRQYQINSERDPYIRRLCLDWARVAADWQGIIIAPYIWERRLHDDTGWYSSWDCASGCIWDADAICKITPLAPAHPDGGTG